MPERVVYIRGLSTPDVDDLAANSDLLADLKAVAGLADDKVHSLYQRLSEAKGFLDRKALTAAVRDVVDDEMAAQPVSRLLRNLEPKDVEPLLEALSERRKVVEDFPLDEPVLDRVRQILPTIIQPYPALTRFEKAERLAKLTGQQLESIELICDLRPIFDEDRRQIEGIMPYTRLRVVATGADGLPSSFEAELTQQQVSDLAGKASKAKVKLEVLRNSAEKWIPGGLPDLPLTRVPQKESSDA